MHSRQKTMCSPTPGSHLGLDLELRIGRGVLDVAETDCSLIIPEPLNLKVSPDAPASGREDGAALCRVPDIERGKPTFALRPDVPSGKPAGPDEAIRILDARHVARFFRMGVR